MDLTIDGQRAFAATGGRPFDAARPTALFIHGAGMDHTVWALQARYFAHHGRSVLAVDLPSGLDTDTGRVPGIAVRATHTLSLLTLKPGLFTAQGRDHAGRVWFDDLGVSAGASSIELAGPEAARALSAPRGHASRQPPQKRHWRSSVAAACRPSRRRSSSE